MLHFYKVRGVDFPRVEVLVVAVGTELEEKFFDTSHPVGTGVLFFTDIAGQFLAGSDLEPLGVFSRGEVDQSPVLEKAVDPHDQTYIPCQDTATMCCRKGFFYVLEPHPHHWIPVVLVQLRVPVFKAEGEGLALRLEEFGEGFLLDGVDFVRTEPVREGREGEVRGRLYNGARDGESVLFEAETRSLRVEVGWVSKQYVGTWS